jgi:CubicO group peptidase (beta-lactamase class C family)
MTSESVARSGSVGKTYTATAVMQLVERGALRLDDTVNRHLPDHQVVNPLGEREITVHDLLTHRSGLSGDAAGSDFVAPLPLGEDLVRRYASASSDFYHGSALPRWSARVGERAEYSNLGLATLGYLVEVANPDGLSFSDYVQRHIMDPLGMTSSSFPPVQDAAHIRPEVRARLTTGYAQVGPIHVPSPDLYLAEFPAGTAVLRAGDHLRLLLAYQGGGTFGDAKLLEPESVELMLRPHVTDLDGDLMKAIGAEGHLGLVWMVSGASGPARYFHHSGAHMWGWTNVGRAYPALDLAIVVFANQWRLHDDPQTRYYTEGRLIADYAARWLRHERPELSRPGQQREWGWRAAYYVGLTMADRLKALLGVPSPLTEETIDAMAAGIRSPLALDVDGFRAGIADLLETDLTMTGVSAFLESARLRVSPAELVILHRELGGTIGPPVLSASW